MNKKGIVLENVIVAILTITVLGISINLFRSLAQPPVEYLLGLGEISAFDAAIVERYNTTRNMNANAIQSTNALLYGINKLVEYDHPGIKDYDDMDATGRSFGKAKVIPTEINLRPLFLGAGGENPGKQLARAMVDCWTIFVDEGNNNKYCFAIDPTALKTSVTEENLRKGFEDLQDDPSCNSDCRSLAADLVGTIENIRWDSGLVITPTNEKDHIIVCADNTRLNEIHITTKDSGHCKLSKEEKKANPKQIFIQGFSLPQTITKASNPITYTVEEWLNVYGDPEYVLFYEQFPQEEAAYWHASGYKIAWTGIVMAGAISLGVDVATLGIGRIFRGVGKVLTAIPGVGRGFLAVKGAVADAASFVGRKTIGGLLKRIFKETGEAAAKKAMIKDGVEEITEKFLKNTLKEFAEEVPEATIKAMKETAGETAEKVLAEFGEEATGKFITVSGRLTQEGREELLNRVSKTVFSQETGGAYAQIVTQRAKTLAKGKPYANFWSQARKEVDELIVGKGTGEIGEAIVEVNLRKVSASLMRIYKIKARANNLLGKSLSPELTDAEAKKAIIAMMEEARIGLRSMKSTELRIVAKEVNKLTPSLISDSGEAIFGEVFEAGADRASQKAAKDMMKKRLGQIIDAEGEALYAGASKYAAFFDKTARRSIRTASRQVRTTNLVIATAAYYAMKLESMAEKNYPVGTNAIGLKTPFKHAAVYDDEFTEILIKEQGRKAFMKEFGKDEVHIGLLPEAEAYYLSLTRDKYSWSWWDQEPIRLHLVSPCYADIIMKATRCDCGYEPDEESGWYETNIEYPKLQEMYPDTLPEGKVENFDGEEPMLFRLDEKGRPLKECVPRRNLQFDNLYKPKCIQVNPVLAEGYDYNYCYKGNNPVKSTLSGITTAFEIGLPFLCLALIEAPPVAFACMAGAGFVTAGVGEFAKQELGISQQWPNHG
jgi:hypothetical protein